MVVKALRRNPAVTRLDLDALTRRAFLQRGGAAVGGLALAASIGPVAEAFPPLAPSGYELAPHRQATLAAIVEALAAVIPDVDAEQADAVVANVATAYRTRAPESRRDTDVSLDEVGRHLEPDAFKRLAPDERLELLRAGMTGKGVPRHGIPPDHNPGRVQLVNTAIALAATPFFDAHLSPWTPERFPIQ